MLHHLKLTSTKLGDLIAPVDTKLYDISITFQYCLVRHTEYSLQISNILLTQHNRVV